MNTPSHLWAGRQNPRRYHRPLLCPKPVITPTVSGHFTVRGKWIAVSIALVVGAGFALWVRYAP